MHNKAIILIIFVILTACLILPVDAAEIDVIQNKPFATKPHPTSPTPRPCPFKLIKSTPLPEPFYNEAIKVPEVITSIIELKHLAAARAITIIEKLSPLTSVIQGGCSNALILKGEENDKLIKLLNKIDYPEPQVLIESQVVEVTESGLKQIGFVWGSEQGTFRFSVNKDTGRVQPVDNLIITLKALVSNGQAKIVANPRIATLENREAVINIGSKIPYAVPVTTSGGAAQWAVQYIDSGVSLRITPTLNESNIITALIQSEVSAVSEWRATAAGEFPVISTRNALTQVKVKDGETIVIGGLINEEDHQVGNKIPILGDIPLLGAFFQNKMTQRVKTDIVFLITPHVI